MKPSFEISIAEAQEQERVIRVNVPAAVAGGAAAAFGSFYLARHEKLPAALTQEVLGDVIQDAEQGTMHNLAVDENGLAKANKLSIIKLTSQSEQPLGAFVLPVSKEHLGQTADQVDHSVTEFLAQHPAKAGNTPVVELSVIDGTFEVNPLSQLNFLSKNTDSTLPEQGRYEDGLSFEAYRYQEGEQTKSDDLLQTGQTLQKLVQSEFTAGKVDEASDASEKVVPFTTRQYERLAQLAQDNGYGGVEDFLSAHYFTNPKTNQYDDPKVHGQIDAVLHEVNVLVDRPSVVVRIVERSPSKDGVTAKGCRLQTYAVAEHYHHAEYDPAPVSLGLVTVLGVIAGGIRYHQRRRVLDNERLRKLGLEGPAPDKETFEAVRSGTADTRQKLRVLKYQKAAELIDDTGKRINVKRLFTTGCGVALAGIISVLGVSALGGEKPDEKPVKGPPIHIVRESDNHCSSADMVAIDNDQDPRVEQRDYIINQP